MCSPLYSWLAYIVKNGKAKQPNVVTTLQNMQAASFLTITFLSP
tara:strand:- start:2504 stop:2635 length:132 start_codon:yes stop_codon:yes gene_type:complete